MPTVPAPAPRERRAAPSAIPPGANADEPYEVHVHIGRIDLTAVQEAPPAPKRRPIREPMSLDEYLSRRGRRP